MTDKIRKESRSCDLGINTMAKLSAIEIEAKKAAYKLSRAKPQGIFVAIHKTKDNYWFIVSRPTHNKALAQRLSTGHCKNEIGRVVTLQQARAHSKVIGKEYLV